MDKAGEKVTWSCGTGKREGRRGKRAMGAQKILPLYVFLWTYLYVLVLLVSASFRT